MFKYFKNEKGFTIIEMAIASLITIIISTISVTTVSSSNASISETVVKESAIENCIIIEELIMGEKETGFCDSEWIIPFESPKEITSLYGLRTAPCEEACSVDHKGIDLGAPVGTPILASASGIVIKSENTELCDFDIVIEHKDGEYRTRYLHLSESVEVKVGDTVKQGQVLGYVAEPSSGDCSTGPHLHFEVQEKYTIGFGLFSFYEPVNPIYSFWKSGVDLTQGGIIKSEDKNHIDRVSEHCAEIPELYMCKAG